MAANAGYSDPAAVVQSGNYRHRDGGLLSTATIKRRSATEGRYTNAECNALISCGLVPFQQFPLTIYLMIVRPVTLVGEFVRLEPMTLGHLDGLCDVGLEPELWELQPKFIKTRTDMFGYIEFALGEQAKGNALPFVTIEKSTGKVVGSTRFFEIDAANLRCEIGWTWIAPQWQRTAVNTEAKLLMLGHAFDVWKCNRVQLKTDVLNTQSRNAILRLGAKEEGIFRQHVVCESGRLRDSIYFSIIDSEWPSVKQRLEEKLSV